MENDNVDDEICVVCCAPMSQDDATLQWPGCVHRFHVTCAMNAVQYDVRCPMCRASHVDVKKREITMNDVTPLGTIENAWVRLQMRPRVTIHQSSDSAAAGTPAIPMPHSPFLLLPTHGRSPLVVRRSDAQLAVGNQENILPTHASLSLPQSLTPHMVPSSLVPLLSPPPSTTEDPFATMRVDGVGLDALTALLTSQNPSDGVGIASQGAVRNEELSDDQRRQYRAFLARRRRAIRNNPRLVTLEQRIHVGQRDVNAQADMLNRRWTNITRSAWRDDPDVCELRAVYRRARQNLARNRRIFQSLLDDGMYPS